MTVYYADFVRANTSTTGTGTISLGSAVSGFRTFAQAVTDGHLVSGGSVHYGIQDGTSFESGTGVYTAGSPDTLTRVVSTSSAGGTTAITLTGSAQVYITLVASSLSVTSAASRGAPYRNRLHNAWHDIQQRGASGTQGNAVIATDRWASRYAAGTSSWTVATASTYFTCPPINALQTTATVGSGNAAIHYQIIEARDCYDLVGQTVTLSGWVNATASANTVTTTVQLLYPPSTVDGNPTTSISSTTIPATGGQFSITYTNLPSGVANGLKVLITSTMSGGSATVVLTSTGLQLEVGNSASSLEKRPYTTELLLCQRFFWTGFFYATCTASVASAYIGGTLMFPTPMRNINNGIEIISQSNNNVPTVHNYNFTTNLIAGAYPGTYCQTTTTSTGASWMYMAIMNQADAI